MVVLRSGIATVAIAIDPTFSIDITVPVLP